MKTILNKITTAIGVIIIVLVSFAIGFAVSTWWSLHNMPELEYDDKGNVVGIPN